MIGQLANYWGVGYAPKHHQLLEVGSRACPFQVHERLTRFIPVAGLDSACLGQIE